MLLAQVYGTLCCASECGSIWWVVNNSDTTLYVLAPEFGDEGEEACLVDVGLYLWDKIVEGECDYVIGVFVTVGDDVYHDIEDQVAHIVMMKRVRIVGCKWWMRL